MGLAYQFFLIDNDNRVYRIPISKFEAMLVDPEAHSISQFSGQRVRAANVVVELSNRVPTSVRRISYHVLIFDEAGRLDVAKFHRQEFGKYEQRVVRALSWMRPDPEDDGTVVEAADRFAARGGTWVPSVDLAASIEAAALGHVKTPRL